MKQTQPNSNIFVHCTMNFFPCGNQALKAGRRLQSLAETEPSAPAWSLIQIFPDSLINSRNQKTVFFGLSRQSNCHFPIKLPDIVKRALVGARFARRPCFRHPTEVD
jgi:hypothetical protein